MKHSITFGAVLFGLCLGTALALPTAQAADDTIQVVKATAGKMNVTADVKKVCEGNASCLLPSAKGSLKVSWTCGGHPAYGTFPEGGLAAISCKVSQ
jgi:hypothetical protein